MELGSFPDSSTSKVNMLGYFSTQQHELPQSMSFWNGVHVLRPMETHSRLGQEGGL